MQKYNFRNCKADFVSPIGRFNWLHLFDTPSQYAENSPEYWSGVLTFDPEDVVLQKFPSQIEEFYKLQRDVEAQLFSQLKADNAKKIPADLVPYLRPSSGLRDAATKEDGDTAPRQLTFKTLRRADWVNEGRPAFFAADGTLLDLDAAKKLFYSGAYGRVRGSLRVSMLNEGGIAYITYSPRGVQFFTDGERLDSGSVSMDSLEPQAAPAEYDNAAMPSEDVGI